MDLVCPCGAGATDHAGICSADGVAAALRPRIQSARARPSWSSSDSADRVQSGARICRAGTRVARFILLLRVFGALPSGLAAASAASGGSSGAAYGRGMTIESFDSEG